MKRVASWIFMAAFAALAAHADETANLAVADVLKSPDTFHEKVVKVTGPVIEFRQRTSRAGNPYFTFKLGTEKSHLNVYGRGTAKPEVKNGAKVEVTGTFRKEKKVQDFVVKNEIDVSSRDPKTRFGVKVVEPAK